jgi:hypothetical protein
MAAKKVTGFPEPEFYNSVQLRAYCNDVRKACHQTSMILHIGASEIEAALETIGKRGGLIAKWKRKRRARRVAKHMKHAAGCVVMAGAASVRTWGAFRHEFGPELTPVRGRQDAFKVVPE